MRLTALRCGLFLVSLLLAGCGFQPVYGTRAEGGSSPLLSQVEITPVPGRVGQLFKATLEDKLNPNAIDAPARYELTPVIQVQSIPISISRDGTASRFRVFYSTSFTLYDRDAGKKIHTGKIQRAGSYEVSNEADYSTFVAEQDAILRGLDELSHDYFLRISSILKKYESEQGQGV